MNGNDWVAFTERCPTSEQVERGIWLGSVRDQVVKWSRTPDAAHAPRPGSTWTHWKPADMPSPPPRALMSQEQSDDIDARQLFADPRAGISLGDGLEDTFAAGYVCGAKAARAAAAAAAAPGEGSR